MGSPPTLLPQRDRSPAGSSAGTQHLGHSDWARLVLILQSMRQSQTMKSGWMRTATIKHKLSVISWGQASTILSESLSCAYLPHDAGYHPLFLRLLRQVCLVSNILKLGRLVFDFHLHRLLIFGHLFLVLRVVRAQNADGKQSRIGGIINPDCRNGDASLWCCVSFCW